MKKGPNLPFEFGYSWWTTSGEVEHWFGLLCNRCNIIVVKRIQICLCMDVQGSKGIPPHLAQHWIKFNTNIHAWHQTWY